MTWTPLRTVLVGLGKVGARYAEDPIMAQYYPYATHAQVLAVHPAFAWEAVVDTADTALQMARERWPHLYAVKSVKELLRRCEPEVAVIATPPQSRLALIECMPTLRAIIVEKPLGLTLRDAQDFLAPCQRHGLLVQVNFWRRADETFQALAAGQLRELIGRPQTIFGLYGNGLHNNGSHMVDAVRMLFGEVEAVQVVGGVAPYPAGPIPGDIQMPFTMRLRGGLIVTMQPLRFEHYRENCLDIWGEQARLAIMQEGLSTLVYPRRKNRAMQGEWEIASDAAKMLASSVGQAFYRMYSNMAAVVHGGESLYSPGESALQTAGVIQAVLDSAQQDGGLIEIKAVSQSDGGSR